MYLTRPSKGKPWHWLRRWNSIPPSTGSTWRISHADSLKALVRKLDKQIETTLDRIVDASTTSVQAAREKRVAKLELEKQLAAEQMANLGRPKGSLEEISQTALDFLANPLKLWRYGGFSGKRLAMKLVFSERLTYVRNQGYRTPNLSLPFKAMRDFFDPNLGMARPEGVSSNALFEILAKWETVLKSIGYAANDEPNAVREARP